MGLSFPSLLGRGLGVGGLCFGSRNFYEGCGVEHTESDACTGLGRPCCAVLEDKCGTVSNGCRLIGTGTDKGDVSSLVVFGQS